MLVRRKCVPGEHIAAWTEIAAESRTQQNRVTFQQALACGLPAFDEAFVDYASVSGVRPELAVKHVM